MKTTMSNNILHMSLRSKTVRYKCVYLNILRKLLVIILIFLSCMQSILRRESPPPLLILVALAVFTITLPTAVRKGWCTPSQ